MFAAERLKYLVELPADKRAPAEAEELRDHYLRQVAQEPLRGNYLPLVDARRQSDAFHKDPDGHGGMREMDTPRDTSVLGRGQYDQPPRVSSGVPDMLPATGQRDSRPRLSARPLVGRWPPSTDGPRDRESLLAALLRPGAGRHGQRLWFAAGFQPSGAARLAGRRVCRVGMGRQGAAPDDGDQRRVSAELERPERTGRPRSGQSLGPRFAFSFVGRIARSLLVVGGLPGARDRRAKCQAVPAGGAREAVSHGGEQVA